MSGVNENERVRRLYRLRAEDRAVHSIRRLMLLPDDEHFAVAARAVEDAAGVLAVIRSFHTQPGSEIAAKFDGQVAQLLVIAASLEQTADAAAAIPPPDRRTC